MLDAGGAPADHLDRDHIEAHGARGVALHDVAGGDARVAALLALVDGRLGVDGGVAAPLPSGLDLDQDHFVGAGVEHHEVRLPLGASVPALPQLVPALLEVPPGDQLADAAELGRREPPQLLRVVRARLEQPQVVFQTLALPLAHGTPLIRSVGWDECPAGARTRIRRFRSTGGAAYARRPNGIRTGGYRGPMRRRGMRRGLPPIQNRRAVSRKFPQKLTRWTGVRPRSRMAWMCSGDA